MLACSLALSGGCGDDSGVVVMTITEGGATTSDTSETSVGTSTTGGESTGPDEPSQPSPVAPLFDPEPLDVPVWMLAGQSQTIDADPVRAAIYGDSFALPEEGEAFGVTWSPAPSDPSGALPSGSTSVRYVAAEVEVPEGRYVLAHAGRVTSIFANNAYEQPGGLRGPQWAPVGVAPGETNLIAARVSGDASLQLYTTPDELAFDLSLQLSPDYPAGDTSEQWIGVPILNLTTRPALGARARVLASPYFEETVIEHVGLPAAGRTQVAFHLQPKPALAELGAGQRIDVRLRIEAPGFDYSYEREVELAIVDPASGRAYERTRRARSDGSVQFDAVLPPSNFDPDKQDYGLVLSLHGAGVWATGQVNSYSAKDWAYIVAPTNRDPFGFDWEAFGRVDAIEALDEAMAAFNIDERRVHLTGHSMGGHGTWHVGVHYSHRFGVIMPSAGWIALGVPQGALGAARAASATLDYKDNLAEKRVYILHGKGDNNVSSSEAASMAFSLEGVVDELTLHLEPKVGHWWDLNHAEPGVDCVDWEPVMAMARDREVDPDALEFSWVATSPSVSPRRAYLTLRSRDTPMAPAEFTSAVDGATVTLTTTNVRSLELDLDLLARRGIDTITVDGEGHATAGGGTLVVGPEDGKNAAVSGPLNQVFHRPYCYVYREDGPAAYGQLAAFFASWWTGQARGQACALPLSAVDDGIRDDYNLIYLGVPLTQIGGAATEVGFAWDDDVVEANGQGFPESCAAFVFPEGDRLAAAWVAEPGFEEVCFRVMPFTSSWSLPGYSDEAYRYGGPMPDYAIWRTDGQLLGGMFNPDWTLNADYVSFY